MTTFLNNDNSTLATVHSEKLLAFEALAFEHTDAIYRAAWRMTRNRLDAENLVQEVYVRAFRFFDQFQPGTNFMDCPIGTVMSRLSRARRQLQKYLRDFAIREGYIGRTVRHEKPTPTKESRGRTRHAVAAVVMLLMFVGLFNNLITVGHQTIA